MEETKELSRRCHELRFDILPAEVIDKAKYLTLDYLGVAVRGALSESSRPVYELVSAFGRSRDGSVVMGTEMTATAPYAAFANGTSAHSLELDDVVNEGSLHPAVAVMPAAFAAGEMVRCSGKAFIEAVVAGYETMIRIGKALDPRAHYGQGFHPTGTCGTFGAAAASAKVLGLDLSQLVNAMGIAGSQAAGLMAYLSNGSWTKRMHPGWAAQSGLVASFLARKGFTGPCSILEQKGGFLHAYSPTPKPSELLAGWAKPYRILRTSIKPHACCRYKQGPIDGILKIMREHAVKPSQIKKVTLGILRAGFPIVASPKAAKYAPDSIVDAQFSMPFGAAVAILYGKAGLEQYNERNIRSQEVKSMMKRIVCVEDAALEKVFPERWPAIVKMELKGGAVYTARVEYPRGDPENPLSWDEIIEKFKSLAGAVLPEARLEEIISRIRALDKEDDISRFCALLSKRPRRR